MAYAGFLIDHESEAALIRLNDALCSFERATDRNYTLILVPEHGDEPIHVSHSGKPMPGADPQEALEGALLRRERS